MPCSGIKPMNKTQFTKDSIEAAYCFFHQKWQVYAFSNSERQKDDIEYAISEYVNEMSPALYEALAQGKEGFLLTHSSFADDMKSAVKQLEEQL
ncbi:MAG: hypothetical protein HXO13_05665 [Prevotella salivae]|uniref:Uncharacterized protein n=2 Tax=Segatella salivae TaxID=228604 RepID=E6MRK2_9BACT|nr:hypothetical protein HMPREF9420_2103 [Segatella salivae DSM 15606]MBF1542921.1 hypothetical protein [Segatella salivae]MBF1640984.1 hypothetical protein [Prevotella sp.]MBF1556092.1 hypothetical protein [Segatella salivae]MBF1558837.1 hypothetical protein [Segatella salivae]